MKEFTTDLYDEQDRGYETPCWIWNQSKDHMGYGYTRWRGPMRVAHRVIYELMVGPVPAGLDLDLCRQRDCVNPAHLEPVTRTENARRGAWTKLNPDSVRDIRMRIQKGEARVSVATLHGVHPTTIANVIHGRVWADVT